MKDNIVIKLTNLKKIFRYFERDYKIILWLFTKKGYTKEFRVINDLSLEVSKGEIVGILGKNGAGKSTLLKLISGIYFPTSGKVEVKGTIASLIELGAGFNSELTGRENLMLKGTLLGLSKEYMDDNIDKMIEFADIGEYIDMPLGTYSSGMSARLGFALAVNADPDILIIDEVFAVGDKNFQKKSRAKTEELLKSGKTVLFVSHSETLISEFCDRVIYLKDGKIAYDGEVKKGLATYHADNLKLPKVAHSSFVEYEIVERSPGNKDLRIRLDYGIGAGNQLIQTDKLDNFNFIASRYSISEKESSEFNFADCIVDEVTDELVDIYLNLEEILDAGYFTLNINHTSYKEKDKYTQVINVDKSLEEEGFDYIVSVKKVNNAFAMKVESNKDK